MRGGGTTGWALFAEDGRYWMPAEADQTDGEGVPNIFWEDLDLMRLRIRRNLHPRAHSQAPPNRLCHVVSNVIVESADAGGDIVARSRFHCAEYLRYEVRSFTGRYRHLLARGAGRLPALPCSASTSSTARGRGNTSCSGGFRRTFPRSSPPRKRGARRLWIPAFAGMTGCRAFRSALGALSDSGQS